MSVLMWLTMMVAMMLPSLVPMLQRYGTLWAGEAETRLGRLTTLVGASIMWGECRGSSRTTIKNTR
jgi:predicted metal-binding membrane protein